MLLPEEKYPSSKYKGVVLLKNCITNPNITIGDYTYFDGRESPETFETDNVVFGYTSKLTMGKFCQIAYGSRFILNDANHQMNGFSTYPFYHFGEMSEFCKDWKSYEPTMPQKGDTVIGNDVWFGRECMIMPGVTIGDGAIIGARAVVVKDVPPYTIVAGHPAKEIRKRFSQEVIEKLQEIKWWDWPMEKITKNIPTIVSADIDKLEAVK